MWSDCGECGSWDWVPVSIERVLSDVDSARDREFIRSVAGEHQVQGYACRPCGAVAFVAAEPPVVGKHPRGGARQWGR